MSGVQKLTEGVVRKRQEIVVEVNGEQVKFFANSVNFFDMIDNALNAKVEGASESEALARLVAVSVTDEDGNHFTYEQVRALDAETGKAFLDAAMEVNNRGETGKK